ncbi:MAG: hypothetical protein JWP75_1021 [Frondihabitans sp.]|nr:hypothetical protein [Frondihabitans sp.]
MANDTRQRMVEGAVRLLAQRGLQETSFSSVLELTKAPRGSIYHHFPDGKDQLVAEAVDLAGAHAAAAMEPARGSSADDIAARFLSLWRSVLTYSDYTTGCSVLAVTVASDSNDLLSHTAEVFRAWRAQLAELLQRGGLSATDARRFAASLIAGSEGAVVMSRAEKSVEPFDLVAESLRAQVASLPRGAG